MRHAFPAPSLCGNARTTVRNGGSAQGHVAGDGQDEDPTLGHRERQPDFVIKPGHNHFLPPRNQLLLNSSSERIIAEMQRPHQGENERQHRKWLCSNDLQNQSWRLESRISMLKNPAGQPASPVLSRLPDLVNQERSTDAFLKETHEEEHSVRRCCLRGMRRRIRNPDGVSLFLLTVSRPATILHRVTSLSGRREGATQRGPHKSRLNPTR